MSKTVVVVGGGLGGLAAALALVRKGYPVTLFEAQPRPGGYAIAFKRDDYIFDLALHALPGAFQRVIAELGLKDAIRLIRLKTAFKVHLADFSFQMANDPDALFTELCKTFPAEINNLTDFRDDLLKHIPRYFPVLDGKAGAGEIIRHFIPRIPHFLKHTKISTREYLNRFFSDPKLIAILYQPAVFFGIPMGKFPAINFMMMFYLLMFGGMHTIAGGGQALTDALIDKLRQSGARIFCNAAVDKIIVEKKKATAVRLSDGQLYEAAAVISNVNTPLLAERLIGAEAIPKNYLRNLRRLRPALSVLHLHLGLDCDAREIGIDNHITLFFPDTDIDTHLSGQRRSPELAAFSVLAPGLNDPDKNRNNERIISVLGGVSPEYWLGLPESAYRKAKDKSITQIINRLAAYYPKLPGHIITRDLATPHTFKRYTANPDGAILGFDCSLGNQRTIMKISRLPFKNIFLANAWTGKLGGFMPAINAGLKAAAQVEKRL